METDGVSPATESLESFNDHTVKPPLVLADLLLLYCCLFVLGFVHLELCFIVVTSSPPNRSPKEWMKN